MKHPADILQEYWNYQSFKPFQKEIISSVMNGQDTFALLTTGGGKSLCFQIPALIKNGICIVISPLIALMNNQVDELKKRNIKAIALTNTYSFSELNLLLENCIYGNYKFLYMSPERLQQKNVQEKIKQMNVNLIAIDEAHCISQWGNDFRPSYKNIGLLRELQPNVNCIALTATAKSDVIKDITKELNFSNWQIFKQSFFRKNLAYMVFECQDKFYLIKQILKKNSGSSIIYVRNRKSTLNMSHRLNKIGLKATFYHGGLSTNEKNNNFHSWLNNHVQTIVATNAFGMGINKPDVKTVLHTDLPDSLESYFQEAGRAGRNGDKAFAIVLKNKNDIVKVKNQFLGVLPGVDFIKLLYRKLSAYFQISYGEGTYTSYNFNLNKFCKSYNFNPILVFNALLVLEKNSILSLTQNVKRGSRIKFIISNARLFEYLSKNQEISTIIKSILRTYGGIFDQEITINTFLIADKSDCSEDDVIQTMVRLENDNMITLNLIKTDAMITFIQPREDDKTINRIATFVNLQNKQKSQNINDVINYISNDLICKSEQLLNYFGEPNMVSCGTCSVCINRKEKKPYLVNLNDLEFITSLLTKESLSSRELLEKTSFSSLVLTEILKVLLENETITLTDQNTYKLV